MLRDESSFYSTTSDLPPSKSLLLTSSKQRPNFAHQQPTTFSSIVGAHPQLLQPNNNNTNNVVSAARHAVAFPAHVTTTNAALCSTTIAAQQQLPSALSVNSIGEHDSSSQASNILSAVDDDDNRALLSASVLFAAVNDRLLIADIPPTIGNNDDDKNVAISNLHPHSLRSLDKYHKIMDSAESAIDATKNDEEKATSFIAATKHQKTMHFRDDCNASGAMNERCCGCSSSMKTTKNNGDSADELKCILAGKIDEHNVKVANFRKQHGDVIIQQGVTVNAVYGGMRCKNGSLMALLTETSSLHPDEGIRFRGLSIPECQRQLPKAFGGKQPLPEAVWWLLLTGDVPTLAQTRFISREWARRAHLPMHVTKLIEQLAAASLHPMAQLISAVSALQSESKFARAYKEGVANKTNFWAFIYEDAMDLLAKLPVVAALIYRHTFHRAAAESLPEITALISDDADWATNFASMLGFGANAGFVELLRLFLTIHCDHEGGNISAHACSLVGSALSDPYLAFAAAMAGLAGPLHGLANQEVLTFLSRIIAELGEHFDDEKCLSEWIRAHLRSGRVLPGFGHAVLRVCDPRYLCLQQFAAQHIDPDFAPYRLVRRLFTVAPNLLREQGKARNPFPNVDAHSVAQIQ